MGACLRECGDKYFFVDQFSKQFMTQCVPIFEGGYMIIWWVHFYVFTHILKSMGMGAIIFLGVCFQTCYMFVVDPLAKGCRDGGMGMWLWGWEHGDVKYHWTEFYTCLLIGRNHYFPGGSFSNTFFFCRISWLQYVFFS